MSQTHSPRKEELAITAKAMLDNKADLSYEVAGLADIISGQKGKLPQGFRYWASGEIGVYNQPEYHLVYGNIPIAYWIMNI